MLADAGNRNYEGHLGNTLENLVLCQNKDICLWQTQLEILGQSANAACAQSEAAPCAVADTRLTLKRQHPSQI